MNLIKYSATVVLVSLEWFLLSPALNAQDFDPSVAIRYRQSDTKAIPDFQRHVVPLLGRLGCNSAKCHGSFQGQGGFRLSLFGFDFRSDHQAIIDDASSEEGKRSAAGQPDQSLVLKKATEQVDHEGGKRMEAGSWEYHLLARWIESGATGAKVKNTKSPSRPGNTEFTAEGKKFFRENVQPILVDHCYECHGYNNKKSGFSLNRRDQLIEGGDRGTALVVGNPSKSLLMEAVLHTGDLKMPPSGKLKASQIEVLERWIQLGAPWSGSLDEVGGETQQKLVQLHFEPEQILFHDPAVPVQVRLIAEWESGLREDVTCLARFQTNNDAVVSVNQDGLVRSLAAGDTHVVAFYDNGVAAIPVIRPYEKQVGPRVSLDNETLQSDHPIDQLIHSKLKKLNLVPSGICSDSEFLRRVSIDLTGTLPTPAEIRKFLSDGSAGKRSKKIDELLDRSTYAAWWSNKICDFTGCNPKSISSLLEVAIEEGYAKASRWYDWVFERVDQNLPYDQLVKGIMLADIRSGVGEKGMPYFWTRQSLQEPKDTAMSVAHAFLGIQLQCAECHKHPFDRWTQMDFRDFSLFFDSVTYGKRNSNARSELQLRLLRGGKVQIKKGDDTRQPVFDWMVDRQNPWFAKAFVNRVWASYFHVGIVEPPDQFTPANPPSHPAVLDWLANGFVESNFDMKWLHRQIVTSHTYQRSWKPNPTNQNDRRNYSRMIPRRIPAEVIYDAMKQSTAAQDKLMEVRTNLKRRASGHLSMRMAGTHAMKVFGKPNRSINCDCERVNEPTLLQAIFTQNDPLVRMRLANSGWISEIETRETGGKKTDPRQLVEQVWLRTVCRLPNEPEIERALEHIASQPSLAAGITDLMWAMINTKEYLLNH